MPIYEYVCASCKRKTEVIQAMNAPRRKVCPHCGGKLTKAFSAPAIQFKGSGFYITDYAKKDHVASAKADGAQEKAEKGEKGEKGDSVEKKTDTTEKKSDAPAKSEPPAAAAKDTKSTAKDTKNT